MSSLLHIPTGYILGYASPEIYPAAKYLLDDLGKDEFKGYAHKVFYFENSWARSLRDFYENTGLNLTDCHQCEFELLTED